MSDYLEKLDGNVLVLTLNRPEKLNALSNEMRQGLIESLTRQQTNPTARAILLRAEGRGFCVGADLQPDRIMSRRETIQQEMEDGINRIVSLLRSLPVPVVAAVNGHAAGAGFSLAMAADFALASESAMFHLSFARIGAVPDGGASFFLTQRVGAARATALAMLGESIASVDAAAAGIIHGVTGDSSLAADAWALATRLAAGPTVALGLIKAEISLAQTATLEEVLTFEAACQKTAFNSQDFEEGVMAFQQRRDAKFRGC